jgi:hypothetical protein
LDAALDNLVGNAVTKLNRLTDLFGSRLERGEFSPLKSLACSKGISNRDIKLAFERSLTLCLPCCFALGLMDLTSDCHALCIQLVVMIAKRSDRFGGVVA